MPNAAFEDLVDTFDFLDDWEDRYRHVIDMGRAMADMEEALKVDATKVDGCASQVWIHPTLDTGVFSFVGDSDAMIVKGLIAILQVLYSGQSVETVKATNALEQLARLGLDEHLSAQRSNGLRAMVERIHTSV